MPPKKAHDPSVANVNLNEISDAKLRSSLSDLLSVTKQSGLTNTKKNLKNFLQASMSDLNGPDKHKRASIQGKPKNELVPQ